MASQYARWLDGRALGPNQFCANDKVLDLGAYGSLEVSSMVHKTPTPSPRYRIRRAPWTLPLSVLTRSTTQFTPIDDWMPVDGCARVTVASPLEAKRGNFAVRFLSYDCPSS